MNFTKSHTLNMNKKHYVFSSIKITEHFASANDSLYYNATENIIEICKAIDKNASLEDPKFASLIWKFIHNGT